ncbi:MAG: transketolase [Candidatus Eisenbacteria bacterium]|nr:transketolase [Candidatus Eisenbacteria bacterium]
MTLQGIDRLAVDTIRTLSMDAVQAANSGHPGTPMALAPVMYAIYRGHLRFNPAEPTWPDRDRFVLSNGHACMLLYSMLHLAGYDLSLEDLKSFRQWGSKAPGHPERGHTAGVEVTTGPLGQGIANAVGLAIAERMLAARFNQGGHRIVDHYTIGIAGDGCLMEGVSYEACSLAGHLKLGKLIMLYDDNKISIAGSTALAFTEDVEARFQACGWQTLRVNDANDLEAIDAAMREAKSDPNRPTLILVRSVIGFGSPHRAGTKEAHGEPLGPDEVRLTKRAYGWPEDETFRVPEEVKAHLEGWKERGKAWTMEWGSRFEAYRKQYPAEAAEFERVMSGTLPTGWEAALDGFGADGKPEATRDSGSKAIQALAAVMPELIGGSADLDPSTKTFIKDGGNFDASHQGARNIQFGVREHGMGSLVNGIAAHGGIRPFGATFFVFSDYLRPTVRLASLSKLPSIFVFTHDSIALGEDGPTHQPIEHLASLRAIPGVNVIRPADARETAQAWKVAIARSDGPTCIVLSRQKLPQLDLAGAGEGAAAGVLRGAYVVRELDAASGSGPKPVVTFLATGSEVSAALEAAELLHKDGLACRVVSMPCLELFQQQEPSYRALVLQGPGLKAGNGAGAQVRVTVEAGASMGWHRWAGDNGCVIAMESCGASAPGNVNQERFGFTPEAIARRVREHLAAQ